MGVGGGGVGVGGGAVGVGFGFFVGLGVDVGPAVGVGVGAAVGVGSIDADGSIDAEAEALGEGDGVAHGSKMMFADGSADGTSNDGTTPLASGVGTGKHVTDGLGAAQPCPATIGPQEAPKGRNWEL